MGVLDWKKPTISFYRERLDKTESEPFVVVKAQRFTVESKEDGGFKGVLDDFFKLMGDIDYITSENGRNDKYVMCWFDDRIEDFHEGFRKLNGVTFSSDLSYTSHEGKRTFKVSIQAKHGKLN